MARTEKGATVTRRSWRIAGAAAAATMGAALLVPGLASPSQGTLAVYGAQSAARGIEASLTMKPFVIKPIAQLGVPFVRTSMSSNPLSLSLASQAYPGDLAHFVLSPQAPYQMITVTAQYPSRQEQSHTLAPISQGGLSAGIGAISAVARLLENHASGVTEGIAVRQAPGSTPVLEIAQAEAASDTRVLGAAIEQVARSRVSGISLLGGLVTVEEVISTARSGSDGITGTAEALLTVAGVGVEVGGVRREAVIDSKGIHVRDPSLSQDVNRRLDAQLQQTLGEAGVQVVSGGSTKISEGAVGEATAGGLVVNWSSISTPQGEFTGTVAIAGAFSSSLGALALPGQTTTLPAPTAVAGTTFTGGELGGGFAAAPPVEFAGPAAPAAPAQVTAAPAPGIVLERPVLLRARMPSQALIVPGAALLALAAGVVFVAFVRP